MGNKILVLSTSDFNGGASEYAYRIALFLNELGYEVAFAVREQGRTDPFIYSFPFTIKKSLYKRFVNKVNKTLGVQKTEIRTDKKYAFFDEDEHKKYISAKELLKGIPFVPEIVLTGITNRFVNTTILTEIQELTGARIFLLMVDMFALTGGCHYVWDCKGFENYCQNCPAILDKKDLNYPVENLKIKLSNIRKSGVKIITGSGWTIEQAQRSTLFKNQKEVFNINSCIDTDLFNKKNRNYAKCIFNVDQDARLIFMGTNNLRNKQKGLQYFIEAVNLLWEDGDRELREKGCIMIVGNRNTENELTSKIPFKKHLVDFIKDYRLLSLAYQASDVFVCPSIEDGGPMMVSEALACGTPVVGFRTGVLYNLVKTNYNGYVAEMRNSADLAYGIRKILSLSNIEFQTYSDNAVEMIENFSSKKTLGNVIHNIINF